MNIKFPLCPGCHGILEKHLIDIGCNYHCIHCWLVVCFVGHSQYKCVGVDWWLQNGRNSCFEKLPLYSLKKKRKVAKYKKGKR